MKTKNVMLAISASILLVAGCKDKEVWVEDSPYITVMSPTKNQVLQDKDSIQIKVAIKPKSGYVVSHHVFVIDKEKQTIINSKKLCNCKEKTVVELDTAFMYNIKKTSDLLVQVHAELSDGTYLRDETPFKLIDSKK